MDFREKLNQYPQVGFGLAAVALIVVGSYCWHSIAVANRLPGISDRAYFTIDDTLTGEAAVDALFSAPVSNVPPFDHNGKLASRARCYSCNDGRNVWVQYFYRFTPQVRDKVIEAYDDAAAKGNRLDPDLTPFVESGMEVKAPGNGPWVGFKSPAFKGIIHVTPPPNVPSDDTTFYVP